MTKLTDDEKRKLAADLKTWRGYAPGKVAASVLGMSLKTYQGIEQGRGFGYPVLLRAALKTMEVPRGDAS